MTEALITLDDLSIGYNGQAVLSGISLTIPRTGFCALLGANGSGKTTLLRTLLGLIPPVAGRLTTHPRGNTLNFGYVPQTIQFDPMYLFTGFDVALMGVYGRVPAGRPVPRQERDFVAECLRASGAEGFAGRLFSELSGGQKQRVLIARALATRPEILVLDEPTAGVDRATTAAVLDFIGRLRHEKELTVLLVTHDVASVRQHAEQVLWFFEGRVIHGPASELLCGDRVADLVETGGA